MLHSRMLAIPCGAAAPRRRLLPGALVTLAALATALALPPAPAATEPVGITRFFPQRLTRGTAHTIEIQGFGLQALQAVEISPPEGITVAIPAAPSLDRKKVQRWSVVLTIDAAAAPGQRTVSLVSPLGRSAPVTITIPDHQPVIADLRVEKVQRAPLIVAFTVAVRDEKGDLGETPRTFARLFCKHGTTESSANGVITQRRSDTDLTVASAYLDYEARATPGQCRLAVTAFDADGNQSNWLEATVTFEK